PGRVVSTYENGTLDPDQLPFQLRQWPERMEKANVKEPWPVLLTMRRSTDFGEGGQQFESKDLELTWDRDWSFDRMMPTGTSSPQAIPELGLAYQIKTIVADVVPDRVPDNPLKRGDAIRE